MKCIKCGIELPEGALYCYTCGKKQTPAKKKHRKRVNGSGTIWKMGGNRAKPYGVKRNNVYLGSAATYQEAQAILDKTAGATITDKYNYTFEQVYDAWVPIHTKRVGKSTMASHESNFNKWCKPLYKKMFRTLRADDFQDRVDAMEEDGLAKSTVQKLVQLFSLMSRWAIENDLITTNYAEFVVITAKQKTVRQPFTAEQVDQICNSDKPAAQVAMILLGTGCRPSELFKVPLSACHDDYFVGGSKTEKGRNRTIVVSAPGLDAYRRLLQKARAERQTYLINAYSGNRDAHNYCNRDFDALMDEIGLPEATPYCCRHTYITRAVDAGVKPELLQAQVGHESYSTTIDHYDHVDRDKLMAELRKLG